MQVNPYCWEPGFLTGQRADTSVLLDKTKKSIIEAVFHIKNYGLEDFFAENDIDYDEQCIIRREITPQENHVLLS